MNLAHFLIIAGFTVAILAGWNLRAWLTARRNLMNVYHSVYTLADGRQCEEYFPAPDRRTADFLIRHLGPGIQIVSLREIHCAHLVIDKEIDGIGYEILVSVHRGADGVIRSWCAEDVPEVYLGEPAAPFAWQTRERIETGAVLYHDGQPIDLSPDEEEDAARLISELGAAAAINNTGTLRDIFNPTPAA